MTNTSDPPRPRGGAAMVWALTGKDLAVYGVVCLALCACTAGWAVQIAKPADTDPFDVLLAMYAVCAALMLSMFQFQSKVQGEVSQFLYHRPVGFRRLVALRLAAGAGVITCGMVAGVLLAALWASRAGAQEVPFSWEFLAPFWALHATALLCYVGAAIDVPQTVSGRQRGQPRVGVFVAAAGLGALAVYVWAPAAWIEWVLIALTAPAVITRATQRDYP